MANNKLLTAKEDELLVSYESEEWVSGLSEQSKEQYAAAAKATFKKDKRVNIRISNKDLELLQAKALAEGIPYQTLMSSVLHKYVYGNLVEKTPKSSQ